MVRILSLFIYIISLFLITNCSFKNPGGFFDNRLEELEKEITLKNTKLVFSKSKKFRKEISGEAKINISKPIINENWTQKNLNINNEIPHLSYESKRQLIYKSRKIGKNKHDFKSFSFEPIILNDNVIFYDTLGNIYNFSLNKNKILWRFNFYKKRYKNLPINIKLKYSNNNLIASDNLGYIYSLSISSGALNWAKNYGIPFRSNLKIHNGYIFVLNQDNKYYFIKESNGDLQTSLDTFPSFLKTKQETNISLDTDKGNIYFITSSGELYSINYRTGNINWLSTLLSVSSGVENKSSDLFFSSPIIYFNDNLFFSSSVSTFSINARNGVINWELPFSTRIRPILSEDFIFLASKDGFLINLNSKNGKVIWSTDIFKNNKKLKKKKVGDINSFILASNQILLSTSKGFLIFLNYSDGKIINYIKVSGSGFFSNPIIVDKKLYIIDNKMRILILN